MQKWKLKINVSKTKVLIFSKGRIPSNLKFHIDNNEIEIVKDYKYWNIFGRSGSIQPLENTCKKKQERSWKVYCKSVESTNYLSSANLISLIENILPISMHGSEIWGFENIDIIDRFHLRFCKLILHLKQSTPNVMVSQKGIRFL